RQVPRAPVCPRPAAGIPHSPLLRRLRQPPSPPPARRPPPRLRAPRPAAPARLLRPRLRRVDRLARIQGPAPLRLGQPPRRVFAVDVMVCRKCGGRMRILEVVDTPDAIARVLHGARAPPRPPPPGQLLLLR